MLLSTQYTVRELDAETSDRTLGINKPYPVPYKFHSGRVRESRIFEIVHSRAFRAIYLQQIIDFIGMKVAS